MKNPSTRRANQWPYPPDSDLLAPREQIKFLPDEDDEIPVKSEGNPGSDDLSNAIESTNFNFDRLNLDGTVQEPTVQTQTN